MLNNTKSNYNITATPSAVKAIQNIIEKRNLPGHALRVYVSGMSCSGFQYGMALEENTQSEDFVFNFDNLSIVIDDVSITYMNGATIDYFEDQNGGGFKISNPNQFSTCGVGSCADGSQNQGNGCSGCC